MLRTMNENGKIYAIIPIEEYEKLVANTEEDKEDVRAYDKAIALNEEAFPMELFNAIDSGENPIRTFRNYRKLSSKSLAKMSGISEAYLSQIEAGIRKGTGKTLKSIAKALNVNLDDIV